MTDAQNSQMQREVLDLLAGIAFEITDGVASKQITASVASLGGVESITNEAILFVLTKHSDISVNWPSGGVRVVLEASLRQAISRWTTPLL